MDSLTIFLGMIFSAFGFGYFIYGKKQHRFVPMISGMILMVFPYFVDGAVKIVIAGLILLAAPFIFKQK